MNAEDSAFPVTSDMVSTANTAERRGMANGIDFYVRGMPFRGRLGADLVGLSFDGSEYAVEYRGADRTRELLRTTDFADASERFLREAAETAARFAGQRPALPREPDLPPPTSRRGAARKVLMGCLAGALAGALLLPLLLLFVVLMLSDQGFGSSSSKRAPGSAAAPSRGTRLRRRARLAPRAGRGGDATELSDRLQGMAFVGCFAAGLSGVCVVAWRLWLT
jgi:hypothetical protein